MTRRLNVVWMVSGCLERRTHTHTAAVSAAVTSGTDPRRRASTCSHTSLRSSARTFPVSTTRPLAKTRIRAPHTFFQTRLFFFLLFFKTIDIYFSVFEYLKKETRIFTHPVPSPFPPPKMTGGEWASLGLGYWRSSIQYIIKVNNTYNVF